LAAFIAFVVAISGFAGLSLNTPMDYPEDSILEQGLVKEIVFDEWEYRSPCHVGGRLVVVNPSDVDIVFDLTYLIEYEITSGLAYSLGRRLNEVVKKVTVPAHGEYTVTGFSIDASAPGFYEVGWGGLWRGVYVDRGELVPRLVTEKLIYDQYENLYISFEYYNPKPYAVTFAPPSRVMFWVSRDGGEFETGPGSFISWMSDVTVPPGRTFKMPRYFVTTPEAGYLTFSGMGAQTTVLVLPVSR